MKSITFVMTYSIVSKCYLLYLSFQEIAQGCIQVQCACSVMEKYLKNNEKTSLLPIPTTRYTFHTLINLLPIITNITTVDLKKRYDQGYSNHLKTLPQLPKYYNLHLFLSGTSFFIHIHVLIILSVSYAFISSRSVSPIVIHKILRHCL